MSENQTTALVTPRTSRSLLPPFRNCARDQRILVENRYGVKQYFDPSYIPEDYQEDTRFLLKQWFTKSTTERWSYRWPVPECLIPQMRAENILPQAGLEMQYSYAAKLHQDGTWDICRVIMNGKRFSGGRGGSYWETADKYVDLLYSGLSFDQMSEKITAFNAEHRLLAQQAERRKLAEAAQKKQLEKRYGRI